MPTSFDRDAMLAALESEQNALTALLPRFSDAQWRDASRADGWTAQDIASHVADSIYGLARLTLGEMEPMLPTDPATGWMDASDYNEQRRQQNRTLPREKLASRMAAAFGTARRAIETVPDPEAAGPYGPQHTKAQWLQRIVDHVHEHRSELEELLG